MHRYPISRLVLLVLIFAVVLPVPAALATARAAAAQSIIFQGGGTAAVPTPAAASPAVPPPAPSTPAVPPAAAPPVPIVLSMSELEAVLERIYESVNPSVVHIKAILRPVCFAVTTTSSCAPSTPQQYPPYSVGQSGSGFIWDAGGHIVTNNHVVEGATSLTVTFHDGMTLPARIVGQDPDSDLAVIKVEPGGRVLRPVLVGDSTKVRPGQLAVAIGNPFRLEGTMTFGIVSALGRTLPALGPTTYTIPDVIQIDVPINPGNSGGVLLNLEGRLIGVPSAINSPVLGSVGVGFAVPAVIVKNVVPALIENGRFDHPWTGIEAVTLDAELAKAMGLPETQRGALVMEVALRSPADLAGVRGSSRTVTIDELEYRVGGDVIVAADGQPITRIEDLETYLARYGSVGQVLELKVIRSGKETTLPVKLAPRSGSEQAWTSEDMGGNTWLGITGLPLTADLARAMNLAADEKGILIQSLEAGSPADLAGLEGSYRSYVANGEWMLIGGDVILAANGEPVQTMEGLAAIVRELKPGQAMALTILRDGKKLEVTVLLMARPTATPSRWAAAARFGFGPDDIQVLSPMHRGEAGVAALNARLRDALNPQWGGLGELEIAGRVRREGDRVMQTVNDYARDVFNSDVGRVLAVNPEEKRLSVDFEGNVVSYEAFELEALTLAYAITIHKSQGSEFPAVVVPVLNSHHIMLQRNLLYTAITRARKLVVLVGDPKAIGVAVRNDEVRRRFTALATRLGQSITR